jgi:glycosyltransferase involved in cell wall biosynthesis
MKVVQAVGWYFPDGAGGTEVYVAALSRRLLAAGHQVVVAAPDAGGACERTYTFDGVAVYRYPIAVPASREEAQGSLIIPGAERFHAWLARQRADVIHMHTFVTGLGLPELRVARQLGARVIATTHSSSLGFLCARGTLMRWGRQVCDGIVRPSGCAACLLEARGVPRALAHVTAVAADRFWPHGFGLPGRVGTALSMPGLVRANLDRQRETTELVDVFVVLTRAAREIVAANGFPVEKLKVNQLGVDLDGSGCRTTASHARPPLVAYVGRYESLKGVEVLARAVKRLQPSVNLRVEFRGSVRSAEEQRVFTRVREIVGHDPRVQFGDAVAHAVIGRTLMAYDAICCPSICLEGGPTVALEAHAVGVPVIGSRIGGLEDMVIDGVNGVLLPPGDVESLSAALCSIANSPERTVDQWRTALSAPRTMDDVARDYLAMYGAN